MNLQSAFSKSGIYPFKNAEQMVESLGLKIKPSTLYCNITDENKENVGPSGDATSNEQENEQASSEQEVVKSDAEQNFFENRKGTVVKKVSMKKKRRNISTVIGGKALEGKTEKKIKTYMEESKKKATESKSVSPQNKNKPVETIPKKKVKLTARSKSSFKPQKSPQPGPSCINLLSDSSDNSENETESDIPMESKCCQCKRFYVERDDNQIFSIVSWVQCENCLHWVHLKHCTPIRVARKDTAFTCACCENV